MQNQTADLIRAIPYTLVYLHREGLKVTEIPIAGFTNSPLTEYPFYPVSDTAAPYTDTAEMAREMALAMNRALTVRGLPGRCYATLARDLTKEEIVAINAL